MLDYGHKLDLKLFECSLDVSITMDIGVSIFEFFLCFCMHIFHRSFVIQIWVGYTLDCIFNMVFLNPPHSQQGILSKPEHLSGQNPHGIGYICRVESVWYPYLFQFGDPYHLEKYQHW